MTAPCRSAGGAHAHHHLERGRNHRGPLDTEDLVTGIWYVVGFVIAGTLFVFGTIGLAWLISHRTRGDAAQGLPVRVGHRHLRRHPRPLRHLVLHLRPDVRRLRHRGRSSSSCGRSSSSRSRTRWALFVSMLVFVGILLFGLAYAWRKGVLTWR